MKRILIEWLKKSSIKLILVLIFIFLNIYVSTFSPKIVGKIVDLFYNFQENEGIIIQNIIFLMLTVLGYLITRLPWKILSVDIMLEYEKQIKDALFSHFMKIKMNNLQNIKNGEIMAYFTKDVNETRRFINGITTMGIRSFAIIGITAYTMIKNINLKLTFFTLFPIIISTVFVIIVKGRLEKASAIARKNFSNLSEYVQESTDGIRTIKAYSGEEKQIDVFKQKNKILRDSDIKVSLLTNFISTMVNISFGLGIGISIIYGSKLVMNNVITIGDLIAFNGYILMFLNPIIWIPQIITKSKLAKISFIRLDEMFNLETEEISNSNNIKGTVNGDIVIKDLTFNYPANIEVALNHINLEIKQGETLGIIGKIGSGKTTLMNLLLRLYSVPNGKIFIGNKDINEIKIDELRQSICYITQEHFLFSTTIKENIELFRDGFSEEEIINSTKSAMISEDIARMEDGINTVVGERGIDLSGGQKQRVVISRAFLNESNIVIFDDTFSALDNKTEESLLNNIRELTKDKTCIIISNRISDVKDADKIIVLDNGEIVQSGNHISLIEEKGLYKKFYDKQSSKSDSEVGDLIG